MEAKREAQARARKLRADGQSIGEIAAMLGVAKSSVSLWVRTMPGPRASALPEGATLVSQLPRAVVWRSARTRRCSRCRLLKPLELYGVTHRGRQGWCRACFRDHGRTRDAATKLQARAAHERRRARARTCVLLHLREHPCVDCGERDIAVLEFDHVLDKHRDIAVLVSTGAKVGTIRLEMARCEVVCANCHRRRTAARAGWRRASPTWRLELAALATVKARNQLVIYEQLTRSGCTDCGCRDLVVLDFDHIGAKRGNVSRLANAGYAISTIAAEIAQCEVRCANCHRRRTAGRAGHYRALDDLGVGHDGTAESLTLPPDRRERALALRARGLTIAEIAARVGAAPATVGSWLRDVPQTADERAAMYARRRDERVEAEGHDAEPRRTCRICGVEQPLAQFSRRGTGRRHQCKSCDAARNRARTDEDRARAAAAQRARRAAARSARPQEQP